LKKQFQDVVEENNLLKYKVEILMDMVRWYKSKFTS
jgi:hypothetical protein